MGVDLKSSRHKKKNCNCVVVDVTTYCDDHFAIFANIKLLCCTTETNMFIC